MARPLYVIVPWQFVKIVSIKRRPKKRCCGSNDRPSTLVQTQTRLGPMVYRLTNPGCCTSLITYCNGRNGVGPA